MPSTTNALTDLFSALRQRGDLLARGHNDQADLQATRVAALVGNLTRLVGSKPRMSTDDPPPRQIGLAMARALFTAPHVATTLSFQPTQTPHVPLVPSPALADALGLPAWELQDLREEADRAVSRTLAHARVVSWLWHRFGSPAQDPRPLFRTLFPGHDGLQIAGFRRAGSRLYALVPGQGSPGRQALYHRDQPRRARHRIAPDDTFDPAQVDASLVRALGRGLGVTDDEARRLLATVVAVVPAEDVGAFLQHDRWRAEGWAELTSLGMAVPTTGWATDLVQPTAIAADSLVTVDDGGWNTSPARRTFDRHAMQRVTALAHGRYANLLAHTIAGTGPTHAEIAELYDLGPAMQRVLHPLLHWVANPDTPAHLVAELGLSPEAARTALAQVRETWLDAAQGSWGGPPTPSHPHTVQTLLATHLAVSQQALAHASATPTDPRRDHKRVLPLFAGHYLARAPLGRLWRAQAGRLPPAEDLVGAWFWPLWQRALEVAEARW